jgi:hypothetical protein
VLSCVLRCRPRRQSRLRERAVPATSETPTAASATWMISWIQSMPLVLATPSARAMKVPMSAATMPIAIVTQMEMFCRPARRAAPGRR